MNLDDIVNFLLIAGVVQGFLFNIITLTSRKKVGPVVLFLNLVVLFISLNNLQAWLPHHGFSSGSEFIRYLWVPWYALIYPSFHNFLRHYLGVAEVTRSFIRPALFIFGIEILVRSALILYGQHTAGIDLDHFVETYNVGEEIVNIIFSGYVFYTSCDIVFRRQSLYRDLLGYDDVRWIRIFLYLGISICLIWIVVLTLRARIGFEDQSIYYPIRLSLSALLYWIGYQGLYRYTIVQDRVLLRRSLRAGTAKIPKPGMNMGSGREMKHAQEFNTVREYILDNNRFLDPLLSLNSLAEELKLSPGHLSRIINSQGEQSFNDFINEFRVLQAKEWLSNPEFEAYTMVAIGLECGFNSKSTFYTAFKKFTSMTPTHFRNST